MKDNLSLVVVTIVAVLLLVILPLISVLERQDNMSYNLVMKLTTSFADEVRARGYIDSDSYNKYIQSLSATGNTYDIQMEAHKKILIKDKNFLETNPKYIEDTLVDYNTDIFDAMKSGDATYKQTDLETGKAQDLINNKSNVYLLNKGDEFYIKIKNTNISPVSMIYKYISGSSRETVININYGGVINKKGWDMYNSSDNGIDSESQIDIGLPKNKNNITPIWTFSTDFLDPSIEPFYYYFNLSAVGDIDKTLTFTIDIKGTVVPGVAADSSKILDYIELEGFRGTKTVKSVIGSRYTIELTNMTIMTFSSNAAVCKIIVKEGLSTGEYGVSSRTEGTKFTMFDDLNMHAVAIAGPYTGSTNNLISPVVSGKINVLSGTAISFVINYSAITQIPTKDNILAKLQLTGFVSDHNLTVSDISDITYNAVTKAGSARINLVPTLSADEFQSYDNYLLLQEGSAYTARDKAGDLPSSYSATSQKFDIVKVTTWDYVYTSTNTPYTFVVPYTGTYSLELWGAQGSYWAGKSANAKGGGYSKGDIYLNKDQILYIYVGGVGTLHDGGGWNGGGTGTQCGSRRRSY